ncbi:retrovirus-related pol polyprotein from transposon TNT 1-94 [Tanacetum coccineum]
MLPEDPVDARTLMEKIRNYTLEYGVLHRKSCLVLLMRCVGPLQANYVIREMHMGSCGMHDGPRQVVNFTYDTIVCSLSPQRNRVVERENRSLLRGIKTKMEKGGSAWSEEQEGGEQTPFPLVRNNCSPVSNSHIFNNFDTQASSSHVTIADGSISQVLGSGTVNLSPSISLSLVLSLPKFSFNLLSVSRITSNLQCSVKFYLEYCVFKDLKTKKIIGRGRKCDGLYVFEPKVSKSLVGLSSSSPFEAHCRLGHPSLQSLKKICPEYSHLSSLNCDSCEFAKHKHVHLSPRANKRVASPFELVHSDVWGPCPITSKSSFKYFVTFVDDYSRVTWLYLIKNRSEEYFSETFQSYMLQHGILHESSCVYRPAQNGVAKRKNRHLLEVARALLFQMTVPKPFWADDVSTTCFLINHMPFDVLGGNYPYSVLFPTKPLFPIDPKIFGSMCFVQDTQPNITKLDPKLLKCVFLGYSRIQKGYRCYSSQHHHYLVSRDVTFHEDLPYVSVTTYRHQRENDNLLVYVSPTPIETTKQSAKLDGPLIDAPSGSDLPPPSPTPEPDLPIALRKGKHTCRYLVSAFVSYDGLSTSSRAFDANLDSILVLETVGCILLVVYVVDIVITGSDEAGIKKLKSFIDLLDDAGQIEAKPCDEPMIPKLKLRFEDGRLLHNPEKYRRVVGKLNYLTITRSNIVFSVSVVSQFLTAPRTSHWDVVTQILGYLKVTPRLGILYANHGHHIVEGFTDADYVGCPNNSRSTTGYCVFVGGNLVSWKSKKQNVVSRSSSEAAY